MTTPDLAQPKTLRELPAGFTLKHGSHSSFDDGACLMEAVAYVAGEPHSDHPACTSRVLTSIAIRLNDRWDGEERQLLAPLIPKLIGTRTDWKHDVKRAYAMADACVREIVPMGLDAAKWADLAQRLRDVTPIVDQATAEAARDVCRSVRAEARTRSAAAYAAYAAAAADAADAAYAAAAAAAYAAAYAAADAAADAAAAAYAAYAAAAADAADAAYAAAYAAAAGKSPEERARLRKLARRPIVEATVRAFERVIATPA